MTIAALMFITLRPALASGCFGGNPDVSPRKGSQNVPSNARITITRRLPRTVSWTGPGGQQVAFTQRQAGFGPSAARILTSDARLQPGVHRIHTSDPDAVQTFTVRPILDSLPPEISGTLNLEAINAPERSSECPENIFIRASFPAPTDDRTAINNLAYVVQIHDTPGKQPTGSEVVLLAETVGSGRVSFRFGETGCGCIPRVKLVPGRSYHINVRAMDGAGHESTNRISGTIRVPVAPVPAQR